LPEKCIQVFKPTQNKYATQNRPVIIIPMEQSPYWEANSHSASQVTPHLL